MLRLIFQLTPPSNRGLSDVALRDAWASGSPTPDHTTLKAAWEQDFSDVVPSRRCQRNKRLRIYLIDSRRGCRCSARGSGPPRGHGETSGSARLEEAPSGCRLERRVIIAQELDRDRRRSMTRRLVSTLIAEVERLPSPASRAMRAYDTIAFYGCRYGSSATRVVVPPIKTGAVSRWSFRVKHPRSVPCRKVQAIGRRTMLKKASGD